MIAIPNDVPLVREFCFRAAAAIRPQPRVSGVEWIPQHVVIPAKLGATPGRFNFALYPYSRGVIEAADDPETEAIVLQWGTQLGKTTNVLAVLLHKCVNYPAPAMLIGPDQIETRRMRKLFYGLGDASPRIRDLLLAEPLRNDRFIDLQRSLVWLAWAGSPQTLSGKSCRYVLGSEVDRWPIAKHEGSAVALAEERTKAFFRSLQILEGTPTDGESTIAELYDDSDRRKYHVPCPRCAHFQELRFFPHKQGKYKGCGGVIGLQDEAGRWRSPDEVIETACYLCERGCTIEARHQRRMIAAGVWCPDGQIVDKKGFLQGEPKRSPRIKGFQLSSLYSMTRRWGRVARKYLQTRNTPSKFRVFWNTWLGLKWEEKTRAPKWRELGRRLSGVHLRGTAPAGTLFLTAGADVQKREVYFVVRAWGEGGTSWLVDFGQLKIRIEEQSGRLVRGSHLAQLGEAVCNRSWALAQANTMGRHSLTSRLLLVDSQYEPHDVWDFVRQFPGDRVQAFAGSAQIDQFWRESHVTADAKTGKRKYAGGGMKRIEINSAYYRRDVQDRWAMSPEQPGAWFLFADAVKEGEPYLRQVVNEVETFEPAKRHGQRPKRTWKIVDERTGNHYWDCEVAARAAADIVVGGNFRELVKRFGGVRRAPRAASGEDFSAR